MTLSCGKNRIIAYFMPFLTSSGSISDSEESLSTSSEELVSISFSIISSFRFFLELEAILEIFVDNQLPLLKIN